MLENIPVNDLTIYGALTSLAVVGVTELIKIISKKFGKKVQGQYVVLFLAVLIGSIYQAYTQYLSKEIQDAIWGFVGGSVGFATTIYTFLLKPLKNSFAEYNDQLNT